MALFCLPLVSREWKNGSNGTYNSSHSSIPYEPKASLLKLKAEGLASEAQELKARGSDSQGTVAETLYRTSFRA